MEDSVEGSDIDIDDNSILREEHMAWKSIHLALHPLILINGQLYRGDIEAEELEVAL